MPFKPISTNTLWNIWGVIWHGINTSDYCTMYGMGRAVLGWVCSCCNGCMLHADLCDGLALCTNKNADMQIRSSQGPSIGLVQGPHEDVNTGTHYINGVLYIPAHHSRDGANGCNWKLASLEEAAVCKRPGGPKLFRPGLGQLFPS